MTYIIKRSQEATTCCRNATRGRIQAVRLNDSGSAGRAAHLTLEKDATNPSQKFEKPLFNSRRATNDACTGPELLSDHRDAADRVMQQNIV